MADTPSTHDLSTALADASRLFGRKAELERQRDAIEAEILEVIASIKAASSTIQPLADSITAYANAL